MNLYMWLVSVDKHTVSIIIFNFIRHVTCSNPELYEYFHMDINVSGSATINGQLLSFKWLINISLNIKACEHSCEY